jgi:1-phosphofructokinase family hexose kinase
MILCLGLTPALQRTLLFKSLEINEVNRALAVAVSAAGKSLNTARALASLGAECKVAGFNGGYNGELINRFLIEYGVDSALTAMSGETRICSTLLDQESGTVTELVEEAPEPSQTGIQSFVDDNVNLIKHCKMLVISGTLPPYAGDDFYCRFTSVARKTDVPVVIDSHKSALLSVLPDKPLMAKMNLRELEATFDCVVESDDQIEELLKRVLEQGARSVFMTHGRDDAWLVDENQTLKLTPPEINKHVNPIGSGDCTTAGIAYKLSSGCSLKEAAAFGLACGSANVETLLPAEFDLQRVSELV